MNVNAENKKTFEKNQVKISDGVDGNVKFIHYVVTTGDPDDSGKHYHFKQGVDHVDMIGYDKSGKEIIRSRGDFSMGGDAYYYNAAKFIVNDTNAPNLGVTASMIDHAKITIYFQKKEPCKDYLKNGSWTGWEPANELVHTRYRIKTCERCKAQYKEDGSGNHSFNIIEYTPATCVAEGHQSEKCKDCGYVKNTTLPPLGHDFSSQTVSDTYLRSVQTCTQPSTYFYKCSRCDTSSNGILNTYYAYGSAAGHNWVWEVDSNLSCTSNYTGHKECTRSCHNPDIDGPRKIAFNTVFASAPGHNYTKFVCDKPATCTEPGSGHYECSNEINGKVCGARGDTVTIPALGHHITYDKVTDKPSVYTNGTRTYYCEYCGKPVTTRDVLHRNFNIYLGGKRVTMITKGDNIVWNGSYGEQGSDGGKTTTDNVNSLVESNWYYDY